MDKIVNAVKNFISENHIEGRVLCALSGGCDSVVLLHILSILNVDCIAIHLNHNWRGEQSQRDEDFSRKYSEKLGIKFYCEKLGADVKKTENDAREARYKFFENCVGKFGANAIFLAHNKDDNAQTVLYRIIKGTGIKGLCAIPKKRGIFCRPLLEISRDEIEQYAKSAGLDYVFDSSNDDTKYKRNLIRKEIMPLLEQINPHAQEALLSLANLAKLQYETVSSMLNDVKKNVIKDGKINLNKFLGLDYALKLELVNDFLGKYLKYRDFLRIKTFVEFMENNYSNKIKKSLNKDFFLEISDGYAFLSPVRQHVNNEFIRVDKPGIYVFGSKIVEIKKACKGVDLKKPGVNYLNLDFNSDLILRTRRAGDVFSPFGLRSGKMKLKDYLINKKIPRQERENLVLLANNDEILCILGVQISQKAAVEDICSCYEVKISERTCQIKS